MVTTPTPFFPAQTLHPPLSGCLQDSQAWSEGIWGQEARNDPGHTPASFLWFLSDIRRGLKNFPQGRGSRGVGSTPGLLSECKVGRREGGDALFEDKGRVLQGTATPPAGCALPHSPPSPTHSGPQGPGRDNHCYLPRAEMPAQRTGSPRQALSPHVALWGLE